MHFSQKMFGLVTIVLVIFGGVYYYRYSHKKDMSQAVLPPKTILAFLGAPGSGKGTLAKRAVSNLHFMSLSAGDLCRAEIAAGSERGKMIAQCKQGGLIPDDVITTMVDEWLSKNAGHAPIILDGYPRTHAQAEMLAQLLQKKYADYAFGVVYLYISDEQELVNRISGRLVCEKCKAVTNSEQLKGGAEICQICGGKLSRREDDKEEVVRDRLKTFVKNNDEIINYYQNAGVKIQVLDVSHRTPEDIFNEFAHMFAQPAQHAESPAPSEHEALPAEPIASH